MSDDDLRDDLRDEWEDEVVDWLRGMDGTVSWDQLDTLLTPLAAAVLPIVEAEVSKAKAEALRDAAHGKIPRALLCNGLREWLILLANEHEKEPTR